MRELDACCPRGVRQPVTLHDRQCRAGGACFCAGWPDSAETLSKMAFASAVAHFLSSLIGLLWRAAFWGKYIALCTVAAAAVAWPFKGAVYSELARVTLRSWGVFNSLLDADFLSGELGWQGPRHQCGGEGACTCLLAAGEVRVGSGGVFGGSAAAGCRRACSRGPSTCCRQGGLGRCALAAPACFAVQQQRGAAALAAGVRPRAAGKRGLALNILTTCTQLRDALQMTCSASAGGITRSSLRC